MKPVMTFAAITIICAIAGCSKSKKSSPQQSISATINGVSFSSQICSIGGSAIGDLFIHGGDPSDSGRYITLSLTNYKAGATGTYAITTYPDVTVAATVDSNKMGLDATSGTITIKTATTSEITGTFSFTNTNGTVVTTVTNGVFDAIK